MKVLTHFGITKLIASFLIFFLAATYITFPLLFKLGEITTGFGDELLIAWIMNWVVHALTTNPIMVFDANIFYPYHNSLAYSDTHFISSIIGIIPWSLFHEPIAMFNFTIISSIILVGFSTYLLAYYLSKDFFASLLSGTLIIFSPAFLDKIVHIQILAIQWVPLAILCFFIYLEKNKLRYLILSCIFFLIQTYNSFLPGYFILFSWIVIGFFTFLQDRKSIKTFIHRKSTGILVITFFLLIPLAKPYYEVSHEFAYVRDIRDSIHFALQPEDLLYANQFTRLQPLLSSFQSLNNYPKNASLKPGYIGLVFSALTVLSLLYVIKTIKKRSVALVSLLSISLIGLVLSFGPALHWGRQTIHNPFVIPLPYVLLYYIVPGFQGMRNTARWEMLFILAIAIVIAIMLSRIRKVLTTRVVLGLYVVLFCGIILEFNFPLRFESAMQKRDFPPVYSWLRTTSLDATFIEMPIYVWNMQPYVFEENYREYYSVVHFRKSVNGASGFTPPPWENMARNLLKDFPSDDSYNHFRSIGIDYVIVHRDQYNKLVEDNVEVDRIRIKSGNEIVDQLENDKRYEKVKQFGDTLVFKIW